MLSYCNDVDIDNSMEEVEIKNMVITEEINLKISLQDIIMSLKTSVLILMNLNTVPGLFYKDAMDRVLLFFLVAK